MREIRIKLLFVIFISCFLVGCSSDADSSSSSVIKKETKGMGTITCTRAASAGDGIDVDLSYEVYYEGDYVQVLHSIEKVTSSSSTSLDTYENAYREIYEHYKNLAYYDNTITRTDDSVTSDTVINYGKIDIQKLLDIEGEEDNVVEDGKVKVDTWVSFAKKYGATCSDVSSS